MKMFCSHLFVRLFEIAIKSLMALLSTFIFSLLSGTEMSRTRHMLLELCL